MNIEIIIKYWNGISSLFLEMAPYLMLGFLISGLLYIFISKETITNNLGNPGFLSIIKAAIFGVPMPLCSCGVIPVAASLYKRGASKGATLSFLISTPQTGVDSILITYGMLGPLFAMTRPIIALFTGVIGGLFTEKIISEDYTTSIKTKHKHPKKTLKDAIVYAFITLPQDIAMPLMKGVLLAGLVTILVPENFFHDYGITGWSAMMLMAFVSIPMYICATASVPIAAGLILSGNLEPGAAFVFLMAGPATNMATITTIWSTLGKKSTFIYLFSVSLIAIITGILMNTLFIFNSIEASHYHNHVYSILDHAITIFFIIIIVNALFNFYPKQHSNINYNLVIDIKGMTCSHCQESVSNAIYSNVNVNDAVVDLSKSKAYINGTKLDSNKIIDSIKSAGFEALILE